MNRAQRRQQRKLSGRPQEMKDIEADVNRHTADELHAGLVADGVARIAPSNPGQLYWVQCAYVRIAKLRGHRSPDDALAAVAHEVRTMTGLDMPTFR
jgi:hypothetical protein